MFNLIRNSVITKILWGLIGLHLLNISVDPKDLQPEHIPENLSFNDQESILEIIFEQILGYENAFEEYDDYDTENHNNKITIKINLISHHITDLNLNQTHFIKGKTNFSNHKTFLTKGFKKLDIPPPKS